MSNKNNNSTTNVRGNKINNNRNYRDVSSNHNGNISNNNK